MQVPRVYAASVLGGLVLCALYGATSAQTLSAPLTLSSSLYGEGVYIYNPATQTIVSPVEYTSELTMVPWQSYNTSMQWDIAEDYTGTSLVISATAPQAAGCSSGATGLWNAGGTVVPVTTLCSPATSLYTTFSFVPTAKANTYLIVPEQSLLACVTIVNNAPTVPVCNRLGAATHWQLVTIS